MRNLLALLLVTASCSAHTVAPAQSTRLPVVMANAAAADLETRVEACLAVCGPGSLGDECTQACLDDTEQSEPGGPQLIDAFPE